MQAAKPSRTAWAAARYRAAHQLLDEGRIFTDPLAVRILGEDAESIVREPEEQPSGPRMRLFIAVRTRFAEDALSAAIERGTRQLVILGAGLDTFAYRSPLRDRIRIFEVDYAATQAWKRQLLQNAAIPIPDSLNYVPIDFEREALPDVLASAHFDPQEQTFFTWLGVVPYLTPEAMRKTLGFIASLPGGAHVVFDYSDPPDSLPADLRMDHERRAARVAELGEPFVNYLEAERLRAELMALGFTEIEDLGPAQIAARYFPNWQGTAPARGGHVVRANTLHDV
jgi:methyltransferase (TIGR00027 family)